ncbi:MAG: zinc ABC transporter substrate-binding protein [Bacteroidales bacterium]|nr:zinc ABC transporter substrate-binding protein [Bacteroidales bacterium]
MNKRTISGILLLLLASCSPGSDTSDRPVVSVSILPQQYFIERLAGDGVDVNVMIPPGASPATYEPTVSQLSKLDQSQVYMRIGHVGFEKSWMRKISSVNSSMKVIDLSMGIELIHEEEANHLHGHAHGGIDPHVWLSPLNAKIISKNIYNELILLIPGDKEMISARYSELELELDSLHRTISTMLSGLDNRNFMIFHPALSYFARDYDLKQFPLEIGGKSPSPAHMIWMTDLGKEKNISTIFLQKQFDQKNAEALAKEIGAEIVQFNPLDPDWHDQMLYIANKLKTSL